MASQRPCRGGDPDGYSIGELTESLYQRIPPHVMVQGHSGAQFLVSPALFSDIAHNNTVGSVHGRDTTTTNGSVHVRDATKMDDLLSTAMNDLLLFVSPPIVTN